MPLEMVSNGAAPISDGQQLLSRARRQCDPVLRRAIESMPESFGNDGGLPPGVVGCPEVSCRRGVGQVCSSSSGYGGSRSMWW
jgi:hypothetical protein